VFTYVRMCVVDGCTHTHTHTLSLSVLTVSKVSSNNQTKNTLLVNSQKLAKTVRAVLALVRRFLLQPLCKSEMCTLP
jgi:hypothetical protein